MTRVKKESKTPRESKHIRWNWEVSPNRQDLVRYHIVAVSESRPDTILQEFLNQMQAFGSMEVVRQDIKGRVANSTFHYVFGSYDSNVRPESLNLHELKIPKKQDRDLIERVAPSIRTGTHSSQGIEEYVARTYR